MAPTTGSTLPCLSTTSVPNDQPTSHGIRQPASDDLGDRGSQVEPLAARLVEGALAGARHARGSSRVEPQHGDSRQRRQSPRHLAVDVAVHHPAVGGERVDADERRDGIALERKGEFADQPQTVVGPQVEGIATRRKHGVRHDRLGHAQYRGAIDDRGPRGPRRSRAAQHGVCQCRRCSRPLGSSEGQATTCGVAGGISWSQPGHRYGFVEPDPVIRRTIHSPSGCCSTVWFA